MASTRKPKTWSDVHAAVDQRRIELGWSKSDLYRATGISQATFSRMLRTGAPISSAHKVRGLCDALGWTSDSVNRILAGRQPELAEPVNGDVVQLVDIMQRMSEENQSLRHLLADLARRVEQLEQRQRR
jgi:DNA-binding Xre family transcriptional regulator